MFNLKRKKSADGSGGVALSSLSSNQNKFPSHDENSKLVKEQSETSNELCNFSIQILYQYNNEIISKNKCKFQSFFRRTETGVGVEEKAQKTTHGEKYIFHRGS